MNFSFSNSSFNFDKVYDNKRVFDTITEMMAYITSLFTSEITGIVVSQDDITKKTKITNNSGENLTLEINNNTKNFYHKLGFETSGNTRGIGIQMRLERRN